MLISYMGSRDIWREILLEHICHCSAMQQRSMKQIENKQFIYTFKEINYIPIQVLYMI